MIIYDSKLARLLRVGGITLFPFIFIACSKNDCPVWLISHERLHIKQQLRWFIVLFYVVYLWDYAISRIRGMKHSQAYRNIRFEKEAYKKYNGGV